MSINIIETKFTHKSNYSVRSGAPTGFVLHHAAAIKATVEDINNWHLAQDYACIGYHFYVRKDGRIYRGRSENWIGAHTYGHNEKIGICAEGNFEIEKMPTTQRNAIIALLQYLYGKYGQLKVYRHSELDATACPGKHYPFDDIVASSKKTTSTPVTATTTQSTDMNIKQKQWQLYFLGYYWDDIDGIWGTNSANATKEFQSEFGLSADGIFGPNTVTKSKEVISNIQKAVGATADGLAGPSTQAATKTYQAKNGLSADGIAGPMTRAKINGQGATTADFWDSIKYFDKEEMACKCNKYCNGYPAAISKTLMTVADRVRSHFGAPMIISSGLRCNQHNANVGGVSNSRHKLGTAMDFTVSGQNAKTILAYVQKQPEIRYAYAIDSLYVHMDVK